MAFEVYVQRRNSILIPTGREQEEILREVKEGQPLKATLKRERKVEHNAFFHALCQDLAKALREGGDENATLENVKDMILVAIGHFTPMQLPFAVRKKFGVQYYPKPKSVSFQNVDQDEFERILRDATRFILIDLMPHIPLSELKRDIEDRLTRYGVPHDYGRQSA